MGKADLVAEAASHAAPQGEAQDLNGDARAAGQNLPDGGGDVLLFLRGQEAFMEDGLTREADMQLEDIRRRAAPGGGRGRRTGRFQTRGRGEG